MYDAQGTILIIREGRDDRVTDVQTARFYGGSKAFQNSVGHRHAKGCDHGGMRGTKRGKDVE
jgi:hypothetical protein